MLNSELKYNSPSGHTFRHRIVGYLLFSLMAPGLLFNISVISQANANSDHEELSKQIHKEVKNISKNEGFLVDPKITTEIISDAENFSANFCWSEPPRCKKTIPEASVLNAVINSFFQDLQVSPIDIETIASRLARQDGMSMSDAGWPAIRSNEVSVVELPDSLDGAEVSLITSTTKVKLGKAGSLLFIWPGTHQLIATREDGQVIYGTVKASPHSKGVWTESLFQNSLTVGRIDPDISLYCHYAIPQNPDKTTLPAPLGLFNTGRATIGESQEKRISNIIPAARLSGLNIKVTDETERCDRQCLNGISIAFIQAISLWRSGCARCSGNSLVVIRTADQIWLDMRAANRLRDMSRNKNNALDYDLSHIQPAEMQRYQHAPGYWQAGSYIVGYEQIDQDNVLKQELCQITTTPTPDWISFAQGYLCPGKAVLPTEITPELIITKDWTSCGEGAIACAIPGGNIQVTAQYSYWIPGVPASTPILKGSGNSSTPYQINLVILHEVGHWFGLRHPEDIGLAYRDIMKGRTDSENECVSADSLTMLNNATDKRWKYRATANQGLMPGN
ncbi:hypothetical protein [Entomohabitans teleogrylli]|uniref:hypothetical protein n=1 Tax=Entomohabitans teleogrylli TaxID=1384589 RepID=UPI00073DA708|nr:hypothetical protein [Entomohabitans teleogrylli]